ncbi:hypothetical protein [Anabaena sp. CCY 9910]|uniref:hypothetical protein n=1 Tax=Anabaena sp. CCY 9910 TaxID=3103870 RepID=UPI0039DFBEAD
MIPISDDRLKELSDRFPYLDCEVAYLIRLLQDIRKIQEAKSIINVSTVSLQAIEGMDKTVSTLLVRAAKIDLESIQPNQKQQNRQG